MAYLAMLFINLGPIYRIRKMIYIKTDVTSSDSVNKMVLKAKEVFKKIDVLVNNAGINIPRLLVDMKDPHGKYEFDEITFDKIVNVNQKGVFFMYASGSKRNGKRRLWSNNKYVL